MRFSSFNVTATATAAVTRALVVTFLVLLVVVHANNNEIPRTVNLGHGNKDIPTLVKSPEWQPFYHRLLSTPTLADLLSNPESSLPRNLQSDGRPVDELNTPCNQVLDTIPLSSLVEIMTSIINVLAPSGSVQNLYLQSLLVDNLKTGIQVIQVCGSCTESIPNLDNHQDYCGPNHYGNDVLHSGLLLIPTQTPTSTTTDTNSNDKNDTIVPGTHVGYIYTRGTTISLTAEPSLLWMGRQDTHPIIWVYIALASIQSVVFLAPHNMGYGKSSDLYKSYIIRKGYETSIVPLWYQSQTLVQELSGGCAALANAAIVAGYSEGGYSSVVVAHALYQNAGVNILQVQSGAGPYKVSSVGLLGMFQSILNGEFPSDGLLILGLLGTAYSSTYPNLPNFNTSQDILSSLDETRDLVVNALTGIADPLMVDPLLNNLTATSILDLFRPAFVSAMEQFLTNGISDPCSNNSTDLLVELEMDKLCQALVDNDLTMVLEEEIQYPVEFCQSPNDEIVSVNNLPNNLDTFEYFTQVNGISGDHFTAGETCFVHLLSSAVLASTTTLATYPINALHNPQCNASSSSSSSGGGGGGGNNNNDASSAIPTMAPGSMTGEDASSSSSSYIFLMSFHPSTMIGKIPLVMATLYTLQLTIPVLLL